MNYMFAGLGMIGATMLLHLAMYPPLWNYRPIRDRLETINLAVGIPLAIALVAFGAVKELTL